MYPSPSDVTVANMSFITQLSINELIPSTLHLNTSGYYYYEGSMSTPPCTDVVRWNIMHAFGEVSEYQMDLFRKLYADLNGSELIAPNYRDLQYNENDIFGCIKSETSTSSPNTSDDSSGLSGTDIGLIVACVLLFFVAIGAVVLYVRLRKSLAGRDNYAKMGSIN